jgi:2-phosphoglycerate kinase
MGRILIREASGEDAVPFLRGILTRSLQEAGLAFDEAYQVASDVRRELSPSDEDREISNRDLQEIVAKYLEKYFDAEIVGRYLALGTAPATIYVTRDDGTRTPFSRAHHQHFLEPCCLSTRKSAAITNLVYEKLLQAGEDEVSSDEIRALTCRYLKDEVDKHAAERYMKWSRFWHSDRPLLILIGGTAGCGKSSIATDLAHRLDIVRIQSTDMLREVMRMMVPERLLPTLHVSSFRAWEVLPQSGEQELDMDEVVANGYQTQADLLSVACEGAIQRAVKERVSMILEGVHIYPALLQKIPPMDDVIVIPIMLGVLRPKDLRSRLKGRGKEEPDRRGKRYLKHFDSIWRLQSFLLSEGDRVGVPIVVNDDKEAVMREIVRTIIDQLESEEI